MIGYVLLSLLGIGAAAGIIIGLDDDDDDNTFFRPFVPGGDDPAEEPDEITTGTEDDDILTGDDDGSVIEARAGDDTVEGGAGSDQLSGEDGDDRLSGLAGDDALAGGDGNDSLFADDGTDLAFGGAGDDLIWGGSGDDLLVGGAGEDTMNGSTGADVLIGTQTDLGEGTVADIEAQLAASGETDPAAALLASLAIGGAGSDGDAGDVMNGGYGNDNLIIGSDDSATGGAGSDSFGLGDWIQAGRAAEITDYDPESDQIAFNYDAADNVPELTVTDDGSGNALIRMNGETVASVQGAAGNLTADDIALVSYSAEADTGQAVTGTDNAESLETTPNDDLVEGEGGNDTISGLAGNDILRGGTGNDEIDAGGGDDRVFGNEGADTVLGGAGDDFMRGSAGNDLLIDGDGADTFHGDTGDDTIFGSGFGDPSAPDLSADTDTTGDLIDGGTGNDTLYFGFDDTVTGGTGADSFVTTDAIAGDNAPVITDFDNAEDALIVSTAAGAPPSIAIAYSPGATATEGDATVLLDGVAVSVVQGVGTGFTAANVQLNPRAAATP